MPTSPIHLSPRTAAKLDCKGGDPSLFLPHGWGGALARVPHTLGVDSSGEPPVPGSRSSRAPGPGCGAWRDPGREGVPGSPCPGPGTGRGPGEGRGDSRFADITAVLERPGASSPGGRQPRRHGHRAPAAPGTGASGKWRLMAGGLLGDPKGRHASSQHSSSTPDVSSQRPALQFPRTLSLAPHIYRGASLRTDWGRAGGGRAPALGPSAPFHRWGAWWSLINGSDLQGLLSV